MKAANGPRLTRETYVKLGIVLGVSLVVLVNAWSCLSFAPVLHRIGDAAELAEPPAAPEAPEAPELDAASEATASDVDAASKADKADKAAEAKSARSGADAGSDASTLAAAYPMKANSDGALSHVTMDPSEVTSMEIDWPAGRLDIHAVPDADCDGKIQVIETTDRRGAEPLNVELVGGTLRVNANPVFGLIGCSTWANMTKRTLEIGVPESVAADMRNLSLKSASGEATVSGLGFRSIETDVASGRCTLDGVDAQDLTISLASGATSMDGRVDRQLRVDIASGNVDVSSRTTPSSTELSLASGTVELGLPPDAGFTMETDKVSGTFTCDFPATGSVVGDGKARLYTEMASGNVTIRPIG
ncbi:DUF4097 family beta strand repeat protein [Eggerthellaceae bacterium zg-887]|uniref:DUF4097 family beta strand repeat-containing protein n=1 Tax=Xiamenia xianingshaonis TaxID=2682776 RepID=UPI00140DA211|nr:DUF4097 family beta strand repeat-containing protein [Xiamenia xianingshaonis]NHM15132.1 DUF4097 family beta strand repeat protein [Xiamenia xianingshaonis]